MNGKKTARKFTIQFNRTNPSHIEVADILNQQERNGKAQYIVNAVIHYINCNEKPNTQNSVQFDEAFIETVVNRMIRDREGSSVNNSDEPDLIRQAEKPLLPSEEIGFDDSTALDANGFNAVASALAMFRKR